MSEAAIKGLRSLWKETSHRLSFLFFKNIIPFVISAASSLFVGIIWFLGMMFFLGTASQRIVPWYWPYFFGGILVYTGITLILRQLLSKKQYKSLWIPFGLTIIFCCVNIGVSAYLMSKFPLRIIDKQEYELPPGMGGDRL